MVKDIILLWYLMLNIKSDIKLDLLLQYNSEENIYNNLSKIVKDERLSITVRKKILESTLDDAKELMKFLMRKGISFVTYKQENYPSEFYDLQFPPYGVYYKGNIKLLNKRKTSIVGSRKPSFYGLDICSRISSFLSSNNITIVSGLAQGIDAIAHKSALDICGNSIGVLGCGIDVIYPIGNQNLYKRMEQNGLIISEFQPMDKPLKFHFPMRNRLISALGKELIVVEASKKSGSLITANCSADLNRHVMAVPGRVGEKNFEGCNELIRDGALIYTDIDDLRMLFGITDNSNNLLNSKCDKSYLLNIIDKEPTHIDDLIQRVNVDRNTLFRLLFEMQNTKEIICLPGNFYAKLR